ncbi:MAG TPA: recombinase RecA [Acidobacteriaceae bacterium]|nr:recombinase RecA [Acidobacteriaceae bacterium]
MASASHLLQQIEAALADRIPSALTPPPRVIRPTAPTGIAAIDAALGGGLPLGALTELAGPECSGRTSLALSFIAGLTRQGQVCAWIDVSDALHPESAATAGIDLTRLLWIRCGPEAEQLALPGFSEQWQGKIQKNISAPSQNQKKVPLSVTNSPTDQNFAPRCAEPQPTIRKKSREAVPPAILLNSDRVPHIPGFGMWERRKFSLKNGSRLDQALRAADLLLNAGGFAAIVLDMGSVAPEFALRVPLATWFRYRTVAERSQASVLLLTQQACTKSSAGLVLHCAAGSIASDATVLTGAEHRIEIARERFAQITNFTRNPPQSDFSVLHSGNPLRWQTQTPWSAPYPAPSAKAARK